MSESSENSISYEDILYLDLDSSEVLSYYNTENSEERNVDKLQKEIFKRELIRNEIIETEEE